MTTKDCCFTPKDLILRETPVGVAKEDLEFNSLKAPKAYIAGI
jgi:hypothetical protein